MNKAMLTVGVIFLSMLALMLINVIQNYSTGSELDYYLLKETTEAAMIDAVDESAYQHSCTIRIDKEKFVESFLRRFSKSVDQSRDYQVSFYDINETPPKVSVKIASGTVYSFGQKKEDTTNLKIVTNIDMILKSRNTKDELCTNLVRNGKLGVNSTQFVGITS